MRVDASLGRFGPALLAVLLVVMLGCSGGQRLGPKDGEDLPPVELDRVAVGVEAPDFSLRALSGDVVTLSDFRGEKTVLLVFYRGHW